MNMKWKLSTLALATALSFSATAASDVTLSVKGEITPGSCTPTLSATDVDYGTISVAGLTAVSPAMNQLGNKTVNMTITCTAAVPVGVSAVDNRQDSRVALNGNTYIENAGASGTFKVTASGNAYGLGKKGTVNIGSYAIAMNTSQATATDSSDTAFTPDIIGSDISYNPVSIAGWVKAVNAFVNPHDTGASDTILSFARPGTTVPVAIKTATVPLIISSAIQDVSLFSLTGTDKITLDGNATLSLVYL